MKSHTLYKSQHSSHSKGFTLVELIVTMLIIATLAAITSTWAYRALKRSKITAKKTQYHQLFIANQSYSVEHGDAICPPREQAGNDIWRELLEPYLTTSAAKVYTDPFFVPKNKDKTNVTGIGMNRKLLLPEDSQSNTGIGNGVIYQSQITFPATRIFMGDCQNWNLIDSTVDATRHVEGEDENGDDIEKGMYLFFDGSVKLLTESEAIDGINDPEKLQE